MTKEELNEYFQSLDEEVKREFLFCDTAIKMTHSQGEEIPREELVSLIKNTEYEDELEPFVDFWYNKYKDSDPEKLIPKKEPPNSLQK